jgi:hypothetical protein
LSHDIKELGLACGDVGTVVHVYGDGKAYEVEFVTDEGKTVGITTLTNADIRSMKRQEILHVRPLAVA